MKKNYAIARAFLPGAIPVKIGKLLTCTGVRRKCCRREERAVSRNDIILLFLLSSFLLFSCSPDAQTPSQTDTISVYSTSAAQPWMSDLFACANDLSVTLIVSAESPEITLRIGEPETLTSPAYQIDEEEILIVTHRESPVQNLSLEEAQVLFAGQGDDSVQVWGYASEADVQILFDQLVMKGRGISSFARIAASPQEMSDVLNSESNSVGVLPRHWKVGDIREVYSVGMVPVLAITMQEPRRGVGELISCLQK